MRRLSCLQELAGRITEQLLILPMGLTGDEWESIRQQDSDFRVGCMGAATPMGLGLALALPHRKVIVMDGDGGTLMNLGALATLANNSAPNLAVIVFDNESYGSVGNVSTFTKGATNLAEAARGIGIKNVYEATSLEGFRSRIIDVIAGTELTYTVAKVEPGLQSGIVRGSVDGIERKYKFVRYVERMEKKSILSPPKQKRKAVTE